MAAAEVLASAIQRSPEDRPCDVPFDRLSHQKVAPILDETIERFDLDDVPQLALHRIHAHETEFMMLSRSSFGVHSSR